MASDLYHDIMKDKEHLEQSNPRLRMGSGGLTSSDFEYRNYLSSSKSRNKINDSRSSTPSFVDSAVKAQNAINSHITKNSNVTSANMSLRNNSHSSDPEAVGTESIQSVGKLRSLFDKSPETKRKSNINVDSILATESEAVPADSNESIAKINVNNPKYRKDSNKRSSVSEFDNFEDRIVPSGKLKIDVDSLVASSDLPSEELKPIANDLSDKKQDNNIDFRKELELERLKRTEEEVHIEKRFNIKRRSLKDKLKDILSPTSDYSYGFEEVNNSKEEKPTKQKEIIDSSGKEIIKKDKNDNYKSAVERFDEFLTSEKISPSDEVTGQIELKDGDELITSSETDELLLEPNLDNSTSLMDSILHHIEDNSDDKTNESYIHLLHPSDAKSSQFSTDNIDGSLSNNSSLEEIDAESTNTEDYSEEGYTSESTTCNSDTESQQTEDDTTAVEEYEDIEEDLPVLKSCLSRTDNKEKRRIGFHNKIEDYILTYGPSEYDRANADIDPIASSAEWELEKRVDNMDVFSVDLEKDERGLGLSIIGLGVGTETGVEKLGIFVKTLTENGAAQKDGRIQVNDQILEVNGVSLVGVTQYFAAQTLKNTSGIVRFLMGREKSRRTNIAPGSALAENPEMQRHIQEMKQTLHQMEEMEDRALSAEKTLEEVKEELLAAEERAHEAEQQLKETKDQLKAVAESPFVNGQRKMKNEIKKKAGKSEKIDDLQKTLKDMSKRLSSSEENLLELSTKNEDKEKKLFEFESRIGKLEIENDNLSETNMNLNNNINMKNDEIIELTKQNEQLKAKLQKLSDQLETDKIYFEEREVNLKEQYAKEKEKSIKEMEELLGNFRKQEETVLNLQSQVSSSEKMRAEIIDLKEKLQDFDNLKVQVKLQGELVLENEKVMKEQNAEIDQLQKTKEYLQILITKLDDTESETIQQLNEMIKEKENVFNNERNELLSKISELESKSENTADIREIEVDVTTPVQHKIDTPPLPQRKSPTSSESSTAPFIARETKPSIPSVDLPLEESKASYVNDVIVASTVEDNFTAPSFSSIRDFDTESSSSSIPDSSTEDLVVEFEFDITIPKGGTLDKPDRTLSSNDQLAAPKAEFDSSYNNEELTGSVDTVISVDPSDEPYLVIDVPLQLSEIKRTSNSSSDDEDSHIKENRQIELESFNAEVNVKQDENIEDSGIQRDISPTSEIPVPSSISVELPVQKNINYTDVDVPSSYVVTSLSDNNNDEIMLPTNLESERDFEEGITSVENTSETYKIPDKFIVGSPISLSLPLQIDDGTVESETTPDIKNYEIETEVPDKHLDEVIPTKSITSDRPASFKEQFSLDEGQFEMVQEDFQEEPHTPLTLAKHNNTTLDVASSSDEDLTASASYELDESMRKDSFSNWLGQDLKRMGTLEKEARAEIIAQQVLAKSPVKRQSSSASSSSSDDGKEPGSLIDEPLDRKQSVKIDSSYFEKSNLEESFDANFGMGVSILDDEVEHPTAHEPVSVKRSSSFDSAIPETRVLDNRMLQAKRAIVKFDNRRKPTKGIHGSIAEGLDDEFQINSLSNVAAKPEFKSTPNLLSSTSTPASVSHKAVSLPRSNSFTATNKPEKKHRFPFHLPKVFKKKVGRKSSQSGPVSPTYTPNDSSFNKSVTLPANTANVSSVSSVQSARSTSHIEDSPTLNSSEPRSSDSDLVPMHEKTSVTNDVGNSDAATDEESVVPFAAKEELMLNNNKSDGSPVMTFRINNGHQHYQQSPTSSQSSHITVSDASHESGFNERAIDVGFIEEANDMVSKVPAQQWNTTQVGLWLIENNLSNYVNPFKLHRVDGVTLLRANGSALKDIGVSNYEDRAEFKRLIRELRAKLDKNDFARLKIKDKNRYQFWRGKHKLSQ